MKLLVCESENDHISSLGVVNKFNKDNEMIHRIQQLELALQQAHENYKSLSNGIINYFDGFSMNFFYYYYIYNICIFGYYSFIESDVQKIILVKTETKKLKSMKLKKASDDINCFYKRKSRKNNHLQGFVKDIECKINPRKCKFDFVNFNLKVSHPN